MPIELDPSTQGIIVVTLNIIWFAMQRWDAYRAKQRAGVVVAKIEETKAVAIQKIEENTLMNAEALNVANGHNEKIAVVTEIATQTAVANMNDVMAALRQNAHEIALVKATSEETRRLVQMRLAQTGLNAPPNTGA